MMYYKKFQTFRDKCTMVWISMGNLISVSYHVINAFSNFLILLSKFLIWRTKSKSIEYSSYGKFEYRKSLYTYLNNSGMTIESNVYWRNWVVKLVHAFSIFFSAFKFSQLRFSLPHMMRDGNPFESVRRSGINVHLITTKNCIQNKIENR